ncbi:MAG: hypothetical protein KGR69_02680 [Verrucomicrobia bacterium]|nr:hypothetical protein [Verrucomicrobiota bacterium]
MYDLVTSNFGHTHAGGVLAETIKGRTLRYSIYDILTKSEFLRDFRETAARHTRGCVVLERPDLVKALAEKHGAADTTVRKTAITEFEAMTPRNSQWLPTGGEIPEKHPVYRWAKRIWVNDFGVYDGLDASAGPKAGREQTTAVR